MRLKGRIIEANALLNFQKERMFELMSFYFENVKRDAFNKDLSEKQWVILLEDSVDSEIQGFSTQMLMDEIVDGVKVKAVFSGDTVIDKKYWGGKELVRVWGKFIFTLMEKYKDYRLYWFLVSMGYRTYRFLKVYFYEFYPSYNNPTPEFEKRVLNAIALKKYPAEYNTNSGVVHFVYPREYLKSGIADLTPQRLTDPHIRFFVQQNSLFIRGDELACLAELKEENMKPIFKRIICGEEQSPGGR